MKLTSMQLPSKPLKESTSGSLKPNPYSYSHRITLNDDALDKLGINEAKVGDVFDVMAHGHVVDSSQSESENGKKSRSVELQLKKMAAKKQSGGTSMLDAVNEGISGAGSGNDE